ncbi:MAG: MtnX-like HAD-IB family phosphatase [Candidatus Velthaea sp.]
MIVFVDYDGTITDVDTFDALVRYGASVEAWDEIDGALVAGRMRLRDALAAQAAVMRIPKRDALAYLEATATVDPAFAPFVARARAHDADVCVVSSGIASIIVPALQRAGVDVPVFANDVDFAESGWTMTFIDESDNGHDKAARVRSARAAGEHTVYIGDGMSDFEAALAADRVFAKRGRPLERYCRERNVTFAAFDSFSEIESALFS